MSGKSANSPASNSVSFVIWLYFLPALIHLSHFALIQRFLLKHLVQALPSMFTLQYPTGKAKNNRKHRLAGTKSSASITSK